VSPSRLRPAFHLADDAVAPTPVGGNTSPAITPGKEGRMHRLVGALCVVALVSCPRAAAAQVIPLADCVTEGSNPGFTQALFGYRNLESAAVVVPLGPDNFFAPGAVDRGQPTAFEPGEFHRVFAVEFPSNSAIT